nr:HPP family protein [Halomarina sp. PSR21]
MKGERVYRLLGRLRRAERRELHEFRVWLESTRNLLHLSVLVLVPLLIAVVTTISNAFPAFSFLLFPPLAAGTYTLFADPRGKYSSPVRFVAGLTAGAVCGWAAFVAGTFAYPADPTNVHAGSAALAVFLTGAVTWLFDVEEPSAFSSALLILIADVPQSASGRFLFDGRLAYVVSILASSSLIAVAFVLWRRHVYSARSRYLYRSTRGDDHVLVPIRTDDGGSEATAMLGARLAAAHEAGKVVLLDLVTDADLEDAETDPELGVTTTDGTIEPGSGVGTAADDHDPDVEGEDDVQRRAAAAAATDLEARAARVRTKVGVPCQVAVAEAGPNPASTVLDVAHETNCDLIAAPYETERGRLSPFVRRLFRGDVDVLVHRPLGGTTWKRVLVPVRRTGDVAHEMIDFATRLAGRTGRVSVCHCIDREGDRRRAEAMLADAVETVDAAVETRVARSSIETFLEANAEAYDLVIIGASQDRSAASRFVSRPTFERVRDLGCDVAILDRNHRH